MDRLHCQQVLKCEGRKREFQSSVGCRTRHPRVTVLSMFFLLIIWFNPVLVFNISFHLYSVDAAFTPSPKTEKKMYYHVLPWYLKNQ